MGVENGNGGLLQALLAVQKAAEKLPKDGTNPHFNSKFTTLATVVEKSGTLLAENDLVWTAKPISDDQGRPALYYKLAHAPTGEAEEGVMPLILGKADMQGLGSAITYGRRYALQSVLNLASEDDDGTGASGAGEDTRTTGGGHYPSDKPSDKALAELRRQYGRHKPMRPSVLGACLLKVKADATTEDLETGAWATKLTKGQVSDLIDLFKEGTLPTGESDIPNDPDPVAEPVDDDSDIFEPETAGT